MTGKTFTIPFVSHIVLLPWGLRAHSLVPALQSCIYSAYPSMNSLETGLTVLSYKDPRWATVLWGQCSYKGG